MTTIQEAMENSARLISRAESGTIAPTELQIEVAKTLSSPVDARGFMATLATNELPTDKEILAALVNGLHQGKNASYELIIKNIIMSGCAAQQHEKNGLVEEAALSQKTSDRCLQLAKLLNDPELATLASQAIEAIENKASSEKSAKSKSSIAPIDWPQFFSRWGYSEEALKVVLKPLKTVAGALLLLMFSCLPLASAALAERDHKTLLLAGKYYLINHPNDARTLASVGSLEIEFGSYDDAIKHLSKAIEISPLEKAYYIDRADAYLHNGDYDKAINDANVLMKSQNGTELGLALANRGEAYYRKKNYNQAMTDLTSAIHYLPDLGSTYFYRAKTYEQLRHPDLAAADYARARERGFTTDGQAEMSPK